MLKKPHYIALGVVLVLTVIVLKLPSRTAVQCKLALGSLFLPLFGFTSTTQSVLERASNATVSRKDLFKTLEQTKRRVLGHIDEIDEVVAAGLGLSPKELEAIRRRCREFPLDGTVCRPWSRSDNGHGPHWGTCTVSWGSPPSCAES